MWYGKNKEGIVQKIPDEYIVKGWKPTMWNFKRDPKTKKPMRDLSGNIITTTPKIQEAGKICPNLLEIDGDLPKKIVKFLSLRNRQSVINGWLSDWRLGYDGRLSAEITGYTPTFRVKHSKIVNLPKASPEVLKGYEVRSLFVAEKPLVYVSADAAALENRTVADYTWEFDDGEFAKRILNGDSHSFQATVFFPEIAHVDTLAPDFNKDDPKFKPFRNKAKNGGYCLPMNSMVLTSHEGLQPIEYLKIGQFVRAYDQQSQRMVNTRIIDIHIKEDDVYEYVAKRVKGTIFRSVACTEDHRWYGIKDTSKGYPQSYEYFHAKDITENTILFVNSDEKTHDIQTMRFVDFEKIPLGNQKVFCLTTEIGNFVVHQYHSGKYYGVTGNCLNYGGSAKKLAATLGVSETAGKIAYDNYWEKNKGLGLFKQSVEEEWSKQGKKKYVQGKDGKLLSVRSKHLLVNLKGQNLGATVITYAACLMDNYLGWMKLDDKNRPYYEFNGKIVRRLAAFHDQIDFECDPEVADEVGQKIVDCIIKAGKMLSMKVELNGEYKIGANAAEIH